MSDKEIITGYLAIVFDIASTRLRMAWNERHGLPVLDMPDRVRTLLEALVRFEKILAGIQDRKTRTVLRCRYALGMNSYDVALYMNLCSETVYRICKHTLAALN